MENLGLHLITIVGRLEEIGRNDTHSEPTRREATRAARGLHDLLLKLLVLPAEPSSPRRLGMLREIEIVTAGLESAVADPRGIADAIRRTEDLASMIEQFLASHAGA